VSCGCGREPEIQTVVSGRIVMIKGARGIDTFAVRVLRAFAWVNLFFFIAASILILQEYGFTFVTDEELFYDYTEKLLNPFALLVSLSSFLFGIFGWAFCLVVAHMAENLSALRRSFTPSSTPPSAPTPAEDQQNTT